MSGFIVCLSLILGLTGIVGSFVSAIPGPPLAFVGLLLLMLVPQAQIGLWFVVIMGVIALIITVADFLIPIYGTKKTGGSKYGVRGSTIRQVHGYRNELESCPDNPGKVPARDLYRAFLDQWIDWLKGGSKRYKDGRPKLPRRRKKEDAA